MYRLRPKQKAYDEHLQKTGEIGCPFCELENPTLNPPELKTVIEETKHAHVIVNIFPYDTWDGRAVTEHLLLIPKRHVEGLEELTKEERADIMDAYCKYEAAGYSVYNRTSASDARSHIHMHTHFIKADGDAPQRLEFTKKPYTLTIEW